MPLPDTFSKEHADQLKGITLQSLITELAAGVSLQEVAHIPDAIIDRCYEIACKFLDDKRYADAADCFLVLTVLQPFVSEFWLRLGNAETGEQRLDNALDAYSMAMLYDADDPYPHLYSAQIYYHSEDYTKASQCLEICLRLIDEDPAMEMLLPIALNLQKRIKAKGHGR